MWYFPETSKFSFSFCGYLQNCCWKAELPESSPADTRHPCVFSFPLMNTEQPTQPSGQGERNCVKMRYACVNKRLMNEALKAEMKVKQNRQVNHSDTYVSAEIMFLYFLFFFFLSADSSAGDKKYFQFCCWHKCWRLANSLSSTAEEGCFSQEKWGSFVASFLITWFFSYEAPTSTSPPEQPRLACQNWSCV